MTREEAIEVLKDIYNYTRFDIYTTNEARTMAIEALSQEPCDDAVSRQAVLSYLYRVTNQGTGKNKSLEFLEKYIKNMSPVVPNREQGEWRKSVNNGFRTYGCSKCHNFNKFNSKYCPNCGAEMR